MMLDLSAQWLSKTRRSSSNFRWPGHLSVPCLVQNHAVATAQIPRRPERCSSPEIRGKASDSEIVWERRGLFRRRRITPQPG